MGRDGDHYVHRTDTEPIGGQMNPPAMRKDISEDIDTSGRGTRERDYNDHGNFEMPDGEVVDFFFQEDERDEDVRTDGGVAVAQSTAGVPETGDYSAEVEDVSWWDEVEGYNEIEEIEEVFEEAGVKPVYGRQDEFISQYKAFDEEEIYSVVEAVEDIYGGTVEQFVEDVAVSTVHPQHSKQIERGIEREVRIPENFDSFDGYPRAYSGESDA